jgi:predicted Zn-dependent protease
VSRSIRTFLPVPGDPAAVASAFAGDPLRWLPQARREGPGRYAMVLHAGAFTRAVTARLGHPWRAGSTQWRSVTWDPLGDPNEPAPAERFLPSFDGELGLHLQRGGQVTLILDGRYRPPGGALGAAADAALLHRVARGTTERLLEDLAARLAAEALLVADAAAHERHVSTRRRTPDEERPSTVVA